MCEIERQMKRSKLEREGERYEEANSKTLRAGPTTRRLATDLEGEQVGLNDQSLAETASVGCPRPCVLKTFRLLIVRVFLCD